LRPANEAQRKRRNVRVKAPRFISMCRQALLKKAPRQLYLANRPHPAAPPPSTSPHSPLHDLLALQFVQWLGIFAAQEGSS